MTAEELQKIAEGFASKLDLSKFKGDIVLHKEVENEINNVEPGGVGVLYGKQEQSSNPEPEPTPQPEQPTADAKPVDTSKNIHIRLFIAAMKKMQAGLFCEKPLEANIKHAYEWYAVYRLAKDIGIISNFDEYLQLMDGNDWKEKPSTIQNFQIHQDAIDENTPNLGANVGYYNYSYYDATENKIKDYDGTDLDPKKKAATTVDDRRTNWSYGSGKANVNIYGGLIHRVFGGSNTLGNVRKIALTLLDAQDGCDFKVDEAYGGGKSAPMDGAAQLEMACIPGLDAAYGGAEEAEIHNDVTLNITNGTFKRVFGGNNVPSPCAFFSVMRTTAFTEAA